MATRMFRTTKYRFLALTISILFLLAGVVAYIFFGGFNLGIDFQSGFSQKFQIAQPGLTLSYSGRDNVSVDVTGQTLTLAVRSTTTGIAYHEFTFAQYPTLGSLANALQSAESGISATALSADAASSALITGFGLPALLGEEVFTLSIENRNRNQFVTIDEVRSAIEQNAQVQVVGDNYKQIFQIRLANEDNLSQEDLTVQVSQALSSAFGAGSIVTLQTDFVGPKFSASLVTGSILAVLVATALILIYIWFRFRISYALSAIIVLAHDTLALITFILLLRLEVSSTTIAALLTIIGYSLNNVIVIFDRIRENRRIMKDVDLLTLIDTSVSQSLSRTLFSSLTTILAILPLAILASGAIGLFAIEMVFGVAVGAFSSNMLAPALLYWITKQKGLPAAKEVSPEIEADEETQDVATIQSIEIPTIERKLKGKRQERK